MEMGEEMTREEAKAAMAEIDTDGNGLIDFQEFLVWWQMTEAKKTKLERFKSKLKTNVMDAVLGTMLLGKSAVCIPTLGKLYKGIAEIEAFVGVDSSANVLQSILPYWLSNASEEQRNRSSSFVQVNGSLLGAGTVGYEPISYDTGYRTPY